MSEKRKLLDFRTINSTINNYKDIKLLKKGSKKKIIEIVLVVLIYSHLHV